MESLLEVLTQYVEENLISRLLREKAPQIRAAQVRADNLSEALKSQNPEESDRIEKLQIELDNIHSCREQAFLLSGISIGLKLGQL